MRRHAARRRGGFDRRVEHPSQQRAMIGRHWPLLAASAALSLTLPYPSPLRGKGARKHCARKLFPAPPPVIDLRDAEGSLSREAGEG